MPSECGQTMSKDFLNSMLGQIIVSNLTKLMCVKWRHRQCPTSLTIFLYFNTFLFCYVLQFFTHWPLWTRRKNKKKMKTKHIYIAHTQLHTDKKGKNTPQYLLLYLHEKINKWSKCWNDRMLIRFIFAPFHIVGFQRIVWLSDHCLD